MLLKKIVITAGIAILFTTTQHVNAQFKKGSLVVLRVGSDTATVALTSSATPAYLDEFSPTGTKIKEFPIPVTGTAALTMSGTATSEGGITLTSDGKRIIVAGYAAPVGTLSIAKTFSSAVHRIIDEINAAGTVTLAASSDTFQSGNNMRSAVSDTFKHYWGAGGAGGTTFYGNGTPAVLQSFTVNTRVVDIYKKELYFSTGSITGDSGIGVYQVGKGLQKKAGQTITPIVLTGATSSPYGFVFNATGTVLYVATDDTLSGGIQKWMKKKGVFTLIKTFSVGAKLGCRGVCADFTDAKFPVIYATTTDNRIVKIKDSLVKPVAVTLYNYPAGTRNIHGIQFAPFGSTSAFENDQPVSKDALTAAGTDIKLYPNPVSSLANIEVRNNKSEKYNLIISDASGKVESVQQGILSAGNNHIAVNTSSFATGIFFIEIVTNSSKRSLKFVKE